MKKDDALVYVPEENITVSFEVTEEKPFNKCFECRSFRNGCSGPNLFAMTIEQACEFLQLCRIFLKYSYQFVSDSTGLSLATVKRTLTGKIADPSYYTLKSLSDLLMGDPNGKFPCANPDVINDPENAKLLNDALRDLERAVNDNKDYRVALDNIHASYSAEMQIIRDEAKRKVTYLLSELRRLHIENDNLWAENNRKSRVVDMFLAKQNFVLSGEKEIKEIDLYIE